MDDGIPTDITGELRTTIVAGLLRVHSEYLDSRHPYLAKLQKCLGRAFRVYFDSLRRAGWPLTKTLVNESIPQWVFQSAVVKGWVRYPPLRPVQRPPINLVEGGSFKYSPPFQPIPEAELTVQFGAYKVTASYKAWFMKLLESSIAYGQAEVLEHAAAAPESSGAEKVEPPAAPHTAQLDVESPREQLFNTKAKRKEITDQLGGAREAAQLCAVHPRDLYTWIDKRSFATKRPSPRIQKIEEKLLQHRKKLSERTPKK